MAFYLRADFVGNVGDPHHFAKALSLIFLTLYNLGSFTLLEYIMSEKQLLSASLINDRNGMNALAETMRTFTSSQKYALMICAEGFLPNIVQVFQRTEKGTIDVLVGEKVSVKISPRGKMRRFEAF